MCGGGAALVVLLCDCATIKSYPRRKALREMLRGQELPSPARSTLHVTGMMLHESGLGDVQQRSTVRLGNLFPR
jgi:hypothetical protein